MKIEQDPASARQPASAGLAPTAPDAKAGPAASSTTVHASVHAWGTLQPDAVERSAEAALVQEALDAVAERPVVDRERVAALRAAIASGDYRIDAERIAERLLDADAQHERPSSPRTS